jgi:hypothetical protein
MISEKTLVEAKDQSGRVCYKRVYDSAKYSTFPGYKSSVDAAVKDFKGFNVVFTVITA